MKINTGRVAYLSGKMSGVPDYNFPAFHSATEDLRERGWHVLSPAEMEDLEDYPDGVSEWEYRELLMRDLDLISRGGVTDIIVLPGWEQSGGANAEVALGRALNLPILQYPDLEPVGVVPGEVRMTDPETGGQKGVKPERLDLVPVDPMLELSRVYHYGATRKYEDNNYLKGYNWGYSIGALERHILHWKSGETRDPESGLHHLAHMCWHGFALQMFQKYGLGTDDRICTSVFGNNLTESECPTSP